MAGEAVVERSRVAGVHEDMMDEGSGVGALVVVVVLVLNEGATEEVKSIMLVGTAVVVGDTDDEEGEGPFLGRGV